MIRREYPSPLTGINNWKQLSKPEMNPMKSRLYSMFFKTARLIASFAWCLAGPSVAQAADRDPLFRERYGQGDWIIALSYGKGI